MIATLSYRNLEYSHRWLLFLFLATLGGVGMLVLAGWQPAALLICIALALVAPLTLRYPCETFLSLLIIRNLVDIFSDVTVIALGGFAFNLSSLLGVLLIVWGLWYFFSYWPIPTYRGNFALFLFLAMAGMSAVHSLEPLRSLQELIKFTNLALVFIFAYDYTRSWNNFLTLVSVLGAAIVVPAVLGFVQLVIGSGLSNEIENRIYGTFGHPNVFAFSLGLSLNLWIIFFSARRASAPSTPASFAEKDTENESRIASYMARIPAWCVFAALSVLLICTYTRGAWIGVIVSLILIGIRYARKQLLISLGIILIFYLSFPSLNQLVRDMTGFDIAHTQLVRRLGTDDADTSSWHWRLRSWKEVSVRFYGMPFFGYGIGTFQRVRESTVSYLYDLKLEAHNDYVRLALETGYIGIASYVFFLFSIVVRCLSASWTLANPAIRKICYVTAASVIAFLVMSISDNILHATAVDWLWWALMGGACALISLEFKSYRTRVQYPFLNKFLA